MALLKRSYDLLREVLNPPVPHWVPRSLCSPPKRLPMSPREASRVAHRYATEQQYKAERRADRYAVALRRIAKDAHECPAEDKLNAGQIAREALDGLGSP